MDLSQGSLVDAEGRLEALEADRARLQDELAKAIENADVAEMIRKRRTLDKIEVYTYAQRAKIIRLRKAEDEQERQAAINERDALEVELAEATRQYADAVSVADERRVAMQQIQAKLFACDYRCESARQAVNEADKDLKLHVARWHTDAAADDAACSGG